MSVQIMPRGEKRSACREWGGCGPLFYTIKKPLAMIRPRTIKLIGKMDLKNR